MWYPRTGRTSMAGGGALRLSVRGASPVQGGLLATLRRMAWTRGAARIRRSEAGGMIASAAWTIFPIVGSGDRSARRGHVVHKRRSSRRTRLQKLYADAYSAVVSYQEFPSHQSKSRPNDRQPPDRG